MSHFSRVKTIVRDLTILKKALTDLNIDWVSDTKQIKGYKGEMHEVNLIIPQNNNYDIGFNWNNQEYELIADLSFWNQSWSVETFLNKVNQRYAFHKILDETEDQGFKIVNQQNQNNGAVTLTLERWLG
jgi:hypothetical protein